MDEDIEIRLRQNLDSAMARCEEGRACGIAIIALGNDRHSATIWTAGEGSDELRDALMRALPLTRAHPRQDGEQKDIFSVAAVSAVEP